MKAPNNGNPFTTLPVIVLTTFRQLLFRKQVFLLIFFMLIPVAVALVWFGNVKDPEPMDFFSQIYNNLYLHILLLLVSLILSVNIFNAEFKDRTVAYLFTRPVPRWNYYVGKFVGLLLVQFVIVLPSVLITFWIIFAKGGPAGYWDDLGGFLMVSMMAILVYSSFFAMLGIKLRHPLLIGLFTAFVWEIVISGYSTTVAKLTAMYHLQSIAHGTVDDGYFAHLLYYSSVGNSFVVLFCITGTLAGISIYFLYKKELE